MPRVTGRVVRDENIYAPNDSVDHGLDTAVSKEIGSDCPNGASNTMISAATAVTGAEAALQMSQDIMSGLRTQVPVRKEDDSDCPTGGRTVLTTERKVKWFILLVW